MVDILLVVGVVLPLEFVVVLLLLVLLELIFPGPVVVAAVVVAIDVAIGGVGGGAGVMVSPEFCVKARKSLTVAGVIVNAGSRPEPKLKSTTSSTSILAIFARRVVLSYIDVSEIREGDKNY